MVASPPTAPRGCATTAASLCHAHARDRHFELAPFGVCCNAGSTSPTRSRTPIGRGIRRCRHRRGPTDGLRHVGDAAARRRHGDRYGHSKPRWSTSASGCGRRPNRHQSATGAYHRPPPAFRGATGCTERIDPVPGWPSGISSITPFDLVSEPSDPPPPAPPEPPPRHPPNHGRVSFGPRTERTDAKFPSSDDSPPAAPAGRPTRAARAAPARPDR